MNKILAFDCSGEELIVYVKNGKLTNTKTLTASGTEHLLPLIDEALNAVDLRIQDVEVVMVGVGPGSWTGSRVAVTTAFGLQSGNKNLKLMTFNSFDLISYNGKEDLNSIRLVKAYANFVYVEVAGKIMAITKEELNQKYGSRKKNGLTAVTEDTEVRKADIESVVNKLIKTKKFVASSEIEPMYLRLSQAEYQRMGAKKNAD